MIDSQLISSSTHCQCSMLGEAVRKMCVKAHIHAVMLCCRSKRTQNGSNSAWYQISQKAGTTSVMHSMHRRSRLR